MEINSGEGAQVRKAILFSFLRKITFGSCLQSLKVISWNFTFGETSLNCPPRLRANNDRSLQSSSSLSRNPGSQMIVKA